MTVNAYTDVIICSGSLSLIGADPINSLVDPKSPIEGICARLYPLFRAEMLSKYEWNFANPLRQLAAAADADAELKGGYDNAFKLPSDLIAGPFAVYADGDFKKPISDYQNINDHILSNAGSIHVRYRSSAPEDTWPMYFTTLVQVGFASRLSKPVADNTALSTEYRIVAFGSADENGEGGMFKTAKKLDAQSQPMRSLFAQGDPLTSTRY